MRYVFWLYLVASGCAASPARNNDGGVLRWHRNGALHVQGQLEGGVPTGTWRWWADDGSLWRVESYAGGVRHGLARELYWNGKLKFEGTYVDGALDGEWRAYGPEGHLYQRGHARRGRLTGVVETWGRDGALQATEPYTDNRPDGTATLFQGGRPREVCQFRAGLVERCATLDEHGAEIEVTTYRDGLKEGATHAAR